MKTRSGKSFLRPLLAALLCCALFLLPACGAASSEPGSDLPLVESQEEAEQIMEEVREKYQKAARLLAGGLSYTTDEELPEEKAKELGLETHYLRYEVEGYTTLDQLKELMHSVFSDAYFQSSFWMYFPAEDGYSNPKFIEVDGVLYTAESDDFFLGLPSDVTIKSSEPGVLWLTGVDEDNPSVSNARQDVKLVYEDDQWKVDAEEIVE